MGRNTNVEMEIDLEEIDDFLDNEERKAKDKSHERRKEQTVQDLCYKVKGTAKEYAIIEVNGKMKCPICAALVKNRQLHLIEM